MLGVINKSRSLWVGPPFSVDAAVCATTRVFLCVNICIYVCVFPEPQRMNGDDIPIRFV